MAQLNKMNNKGRQSRKAKKLSYNTSSQDNSTREKGKESPSDNAPNIEKIISLAQNNSTQNNYHQVVDILSPLLKGYPFPNKEVNGQFNQLLGLACLHLGQLLEAEKAALRGVADYSDGLDFHYILCQVKHTLREYDASINAGQTFISLYQKKHGNQINSWCQTTRGEIGKVHYLLGSAYQEKADPEHAIACFKKAISSDPGSSLSYLGLARLLFRIQKHEDAVTVLQQGIAKCRNIDELNMMFNWYRSRPTISACMIVKNEEEMLAPCLDSIRDWVDEIIVVDTGSTDRTVAIAESYGAKVYHHPWEGDFSRARNYSLQYATMDWVFIIDADERIGKNEVTPIIQTLMSAPNAIVSINVFNQYEKNKNVTVFLPSTRFFKRSLNLRYKGIVHNQLDIPSDVRVQRTNIQMIHLGYGLSNEKMAQKVARTKSLLEAQLEENPDNPFALFNYAQLLRTNNQGFSIENIPKVIALANHAVEITDPQDPSTRHIHLMCLDQLAWANFFDKQYHRAIEYCEKALKHKPDYLDPMLLLGHLYSQMINFPLALVSFQRYLVEQERYDPARERDNIILLHLNSQIIAYYSMAVIYEQINDLDSSIMYYRKTLALDGNYLNANENLGRVLLCKNELDEARACFTRQLESSPDSVVAMLGLSNICEKTGNGNEAIHLLEASINRGMSDPGIFIELGRLCLHSGNDSKAEEWFSSALSSTDNVVRSLTSIADACQRTGHDRQAKAYYAKLIEMGKATPEILNDLGNCFFRTGDYQQAVTQYRKALDVRSEFPATWRNLGISLVKLGESHEAIQFLERYLKEVPTEADIVSLLADLFMVAGDKHAALRYYEQYVNLRPEDSNGIIQLSECYLTLGHRDAARAGFEFALRSDPLNSRVVERMRELNKETSPG